MFQLLFFSKRKFIYEKIIFMEKKYDFTCKNDSIIREVPNYKRVISFRKCIKCFIDYNNEPSLLSHTFSYCIEKIPPGGYTIPLPTFIMFEIIRQVRKHFLHLKIKYWN